MNHKLKSLLANNTTLGLGFNAVVFFLALSIVHIRIQTTLIGYSLGKLKAEELELLEKKSRTSAALAKISTKSSLLEFSKK